MSWDSPSVFTPRIRRLAEVSDRLVPASTQNLGEVLLAAVQRQLGEGPVHLQVFDPGRHFRLVMGDRYVNVKQDPDTGGLVLALRCADVAIVTEPGPVWDRDLDRWADSFAHHLLSLLRGAAEPRP